MNVSSASISGDTAAQSASAFASNAWLIRPVPPTSTKV